MNFIEFVTISRALDTFMIRHLNKIDWTMLQRTCKALREKIKGKYSASKIALKCLKIGQYYLYIHLYGNRPKFVNVLLFNKCDGRDFEAQKKLIAAGKYGLQLCNVAAKNGHLELLKWARENGHPFNETTCENAAMNGHLYVLQWLRAKGCAWNAHTCGNAAHFGQFETLKWAWANGCPMNKSMTCWFAVIRKNLEMLKWTLEIGCTWEARFTIRAAQDGSLEILKWVKNNGWPVDECVCNAAAANGRLEVLKWAIENGFKWQRSVHGKLGCPSNIEEWADKHFGPKSSSEMEV